jgi:hypothetical protein
MSKPRPAGLNKPPKESKRQIAPPDPLLDGEKLARLLDRYSIKWCSDNSHWLQLALAVAREYTPEFKSDARPAHRPQKWDAAAKFYLAGEIRREMDLGSITRNAAAIRIASREPWRTFLTEGRWRNARHANSADTLLKQFNSMNKAYREIGAKAYLYHVMTKKVDEWEEIVRETLLLSLKKGK